MKGRPCGIMCIAWFRWPSGEKNSCLELFGQSMRLGGRTASAVRPMLAEKRKQMHAVSAGRPMLAGQRRE